MSEAVGAIAAKAKGVSFHIWAEGQHVMCMESNPAYTLHIKWIKMVPEHSICTVCVLRLKETRIA